MATEPESRHDDATEVSIDGQRPAGWQYSLSGLLVVITVVSITLAVGVHYQGPMVAIVAIGIIQATLLLAAGWLIQRRNRWALALLTSVFWAIPGCGLLLLAIGAAYSASVNADRAASVVASLCAIAAGAFCYFMAIKRWRQLMADVPKRTSVEPLENATRHGRD